MKWTLIQYSLDITERFGQRIFPVNPNPASRVFYLGGAEKGLVLISKIRTGANVMRPKLSHS
jgi:hypothetical protein